MTRTVSYTNRKGQTYYLHKSKTKTGKVRYTMKTTKEGAETQLPEGYAITENVNGLVSIGKAKPRQITELEEEYVRAKLRALELRWYRCEAKGKCLVVYEPITTYEQACEILAPFLDPIGLMRSDFGHLPGFEDILADLTNGEPINELEARLKDPKVQRQRLEEMVEERFSDVRVEPILRFILVDNKQRLFTVERIHFSGDMDWMLIDGQPQSIQEATTKYLSHLGKDSFYDLM